MSSTLAEYTPRPGRVLPSVGSRVQRAGGLWKFSAVGACFSFQLLAPELGLIAAAAAAASASHTAG